MTAFGRPAAGLPDRDGRKADGRGLPLRYQKSRIRRVPRYGHQSA